MPRVKKTKTASEDGNTFTKTKSIPFGNKKKIVSYKTNEDGTVTKTVTKTKNEDWLAGDKGRPKSKSSSKVKRQKTISAEKAARQKARRERRVERNAELRDGVKGPRLQDGPSLVGVKASKPDPEDSVKVAAYKAMMKKKGY